MDTTHDVFNQPSPLVGYNLFETHQPLRDALAFNAPQLQLTALQTLGAELGSADMQAHARLANVLTPQLHTHDRFGRRIDEVEFHPSYHALMKAAVGAGLHGTPWGAGGSHVKRAAGFMLFTELEPSILCPISMTYAVAPALRGNTAVYADWAPKLQSHWYDPELKPWPQKPGLTMGMGMTEKQGGSDVRANTTQAVREGSDAWGDRYALTGHKWFFSAPMCDAFLVLAQAPAGLSCLFLPRVLPDGTRNAIRIQRLKDKLATANAKSRAIADIAIRNAQASVLNNLLVNLARYVNNVCAGDVDKAVSSGFVLAKRPEPSTHLEPPTKLAARVSDFEGCVDLNWKRVEDARMYQVYINDTDPGDPAKWSMVAVSSRTRTRITDLLPGKFYSFRVTALGRIGEGPASDVVSGRAA